MLIHAFKLHIRTNKTSLINIKLSKNLLVDPFGIQAVTSADLICCSWRRFTYGLVTSNFINALTGFSCTSIPADCNSFVLGPSIIIGFNGMELFKMKYRTFETIELGLKIKQKKSLTLNKIVLFLYPNKKYLNYIQLTMIPALTVEITSNITSQVKVCVVTDLFLHSILNDEKKNY